MNVYLRRKWKKTSTAYFHILTCYWICGTEKLQQIAVAIARRRAENRTHNLTDTMYKFSPFYREDRLNKRREEGRREWKDVPCLRRSVTIEARLRVQPTRSVICGRQSGTGTGFMRVSWVSLVYIILP